MTEINTVIVKAEVFTFTDILGRDYAWDITLARKLVEDPANVAHVAEIDRENMRGVAANNTWTQARVDAVDPTVPGIGAPVTYDGPEGRASFYIPIDGTHRCVKALQTGQPFFLRLLTEDAAKQCLLHAPEGSMPWEVVEP